MSPATLARLEALRDRAGRGFGLSPSESRRVLAIAVAAAKVQRPPAELRAALEEVLAR